MVSLNDEQTFKELIKSTAHESAPQGMVSTVIKQLELEQSAIRVDNQSLIPKKIILLLSIIVMALVVYALQNSTGSDIPILSDLFQRFSALSFEVSLINNIQILSSIPKHLFILVPVILFQFYWMKNYYEGRYI